MRLQSTPLGPGKHTRARPRAHYPLSQPPTLMHMLNTPPSRSRRRYRCYNLPHSLFCCSQGGEPKQQQQRFEHGGCCPHLPATSLARRLCGEGHSAPLEGGLRLAKQAAGASQATSPAHLLCTLSLCASWWSAGRSLSLPMDWPLINWE